MSSRPQTSSALSRRLAGATLLAALTAASGPVPLLEAGTRPAAAADRAPMSAREKALHALNRLGFGPRPGEVDRVVAMGVSSWIDRQLAPESIPDPGIGARLGDFATLSMSSREIFDTFERPLREARRLRRQAAAAQGSADSMKTDEAAADEEMRNAIPPEKRPRRVIEELSAARVIRAAYSERQANEVLVDFWMNHFNVFAAKGVDRAFITSFERDVVRPRIWGKFEDLLLATAKSPAMLFYLDNALSVAEPDNRPFAPEGRGFPGRRAFARRPGGFENDAAAGLPAGAANRRAGLNENYARELMELHTLGVDGGYTQKDVTELARVLTGWSIDREAGAFVFRPRAHDALSKVVLGRTFAPGGVDEGERAISMLAHHPSTARRIALQLCQRLVADEPPAALVERVAKRFLATDGDLRETVRAVVTSPEFFAPEAYRSKVKSPFEYVVSAIRAAGGDTNARPPVLREIAKMGEPLYLCQPPTGYSDLSSAWVSSGSLVARLNFAVALAANRIPGTTVDLEKLVGPDADVDRLARKLLGTELSPETRKTIEARMAGEGALADGSAPQTYALTAGLILGSPEFQRQ